MTGEPATNSPSADGPGLPTWLVILLSLAVGLGMLYWLAGDFITFQVTLAVTLTEGLFLAAVAIAAGGIGYPLVKRLSGGRGSAGLRVATATGIGLSFLSLVVLAAGSFAHGLLTGWVLGTVVLIGVCAAAWGARFRLKAWRMPPRVGRWSILAILLAAAVAIWLAGAMRPPGMVGRIDGDFYDEMEYHLQLPSEYYQAGHIQPLPHNAYSFYPLGSEMLYLLSMVLRGGAYEGVYLAKMMHGLFGVLGVAAVVCELRRASPSRGWITAVLLATTPGVLVLSWVAKTELAQVAYLAMALLWMRHWLAEGRSRCDSCHPQALLPLAWGCEAPVTRSGEAPRRTPNKTVVGPGTDPTFLGLSALIGLILGASCGTKYLAVGFVALPVGVAMLLACLSNRKRLAGTMLAGTAALAMFSPWLIRNAAAVGNPVFPLGTSLLGKGYWSGEEQTRWAYGTGPEKMPPHPTPDGWAMPSVPSRAERLLDSFLTSPIFGPVTIALAIGGAALIVVASARRRRPESVSCNSSDTLPSSSPRHQRSTHVDGLAADWPVVVVLLVQLVVWIVFTHEMPWRFLLPAVVSLSMLAGAAMSSLAQMTKGRLRGWAKGAAALAIAALLLAGGINLVAADRLLRADTRGLPAGPWDVAQVAAEAPQYAIAWRLPAGSRILLVGEAKAFYFPPGTFYATPFDPHPLARLSRPDVSPQEAIRQLRTMGVTHVWVDWAEILRLAGTYGYPAELAGPVLERWRQGLPPGLPMLQKIGAREVPVESLMEPGSSMVPGRPPNVGRLKPPGIEGEAVIWPVFSVYELPVE